MDKKNSIRISVCIAVCNGSKYIAMQLSSILDQLESNDEIVICDDNSDDDSIEIIHSFVDDRIKLFMNPRRLGHVKNFERAISLAEGEYIYLSDQDDVWLPNRLQMFLDKLINSKNPSLVVGDFIEVDNNFVKLDSKLNNERLGEYTYFKYHFALRILFGKSKFYGCCFAFNSSLRERFLPIPSRIEAHDMWIGLTSALFSNVIIINEITLLRRIHGNNLSPRIRRSITKIILSRFFYVYHLAKLSVFLFRKRFHISL